MTDIHVEQWSHCNKYPAKNVFNKMNIVLA